jgi:alpha-mannosidase
MKRQPVPPRITGFSSCCIANFPIGKPSKLLEALVKSTAPRVWKPAIRRTWNSVLPLASVLVALASLLASRAAAQEAQPAAVNKPLPDGILQLDASAATIHGQTARFEVLQGLGNICYWTNPADWLSWQTAFDHTGEFVVELKYSCDSGSEGSTFDVALGQQQFSSRIAADTGTWYDHQILKLGSLKVAQPGPQTLSLKPTKKPGEAVMNLAWLRIIQASDYPAYLARTAIEHKGTPLKLPAQVFVVPNFHPASCGWLANWSVERNYCANSYLNHLDRVRDDPNYGFALSECNNLIAIQNFQPQRFAELKERVKQGRVELVNGFFLESTINLSGGEALAKMGIEGLRWQQQVMGVRPRYCWAIDVCGTHAQMPQLCEQLGLEALIYTRCNRAGKSIFWSESPDGTRILTLVPGHYSDDIGGVYAAREPLTGAQLAGAAKAISANLGQTPAGAPVLILGGQGDYSLAPARRENPTEFLQQWKKSYPDCEMRYGGLSPFVDALLPGVKSGRIELPTVRTGTSYTFDSFWIECPRVKTWYRRDEHALQAAEALATIASLKAGFAYPAQPFYQAWLQMLLNMDRNTLWGSAGGMVFEHESSWDAKDRFEWVEKQSAATLESAARKLAGDGSAVTLFNAANWKRTDPLRLRLPTDQLLAAATSEAAGDGTIFCQINVPATGLRTAELKTGAAAAPKTVALPATIETRFYSARIDPANGSLVSLRAKPSGREMLGGPANVLVAERHSGHGDPGDFVDARPKRQHLATSQDFKATVSATEGPLAITVEAHGDFFGGGASRRVTRLFKDHPRIEFETELNDIPNLTVVVAEFPLAAAPSEIRRGIPFGFSRDDGAITGIVPTVRWSDYASPGRGGVALLDRGLTGREINDRTPVIYLLNATDKYYGYTNAWLSGRGRHHLEYALVAHEADWSAARVPQLAWEYNCPVAIATACQATQPQSFLQTSDNVIVEAMRRDGADIELRLVEALGKAGTAEIMLNLPHTDAAFTDLNGGRAQKLDGGPAYKLPVRPQQIVTLRFRTETQVAAIKPLLDWDELVPPIKRPALHQYLPDKKGHPPRGS